MAYVIIYLGVPVIASKVTNSAVKSTLGVIYILLLIPVGILRMIEFYRRNDASTKSSQMFNCLFRVPLALFGLLCLAVGVAIIVWVIYNVFIQRQTAYTGSRFVSSLGSFGVGVPLVLYGGYTLRSVLQRKQEIALKLREQQEFELEEHDEASDS